MRSHAITRRRWILAALATVLLAASSAIAAEPEGLQVVFFPSIATVSDDKVGGSMIIQGRVFTPAHRTHSALVWLAAHKFGIDPAAEPFFYRARLFFSDGQKRWRVVVKLGDRTIRLSESRRDGSFSETVPLTAEDLKHAKNDVITFESVASTSGGKTVKGMAVVVPNSAVVVVTDMDDTIKETNVLNHKLAERNTLVEKFTPVKDMSKVYRGWKAVPGAHVHFHVVSAGPWQLFEPLAAFTTGENFPVFTWDMRSVDIGFNLKVARRELKLDPKTVFDHKVQKIRELLKRFPNQVVLVGDSGEKDPEVYAELVKACPHRVAAVFIREIPGAAKRDYAKLFPSTAGVKPHFFREAGDLPNILAPLKSASRSQCR